MRLAWLAATILAATAVAAGCGDNRAIPDAAHVDAPVDTPIPVDANPLEPATLAGTGLCVDDACAQIAADVHEYAPQFVLYADLASKRRWIQLPAGTQIDTTDMDHWVFPQGTKLWKEFTDEHGVRIETRYMAKVLADDSTPGAWFYVSYAWNPAQDATEAITQGLSGANGTDHDIPSRSQCKQCHERSKPSRILGFSAISLDFHQSDASIMDLDDVATAGMLTTNPPGAASPHFPIPGTVAEKAAVGYLHANCSHCHNPSSDVFTNNTMINLRLDTTHLAQITDTGTYTTTVDVTATGALTPSGSDCPSSPCAPLTKLVKSGDAAGSILFFRFNALNTQQHMPQLGEKTTDPDGKMILQTWIDSL